MRWDLKKTAGVLTIAATLAVFGVAEARRGRPEPVAKPRAAQAADISLENAGSDVQSSAALPQSIIMYDEVGYADVTDGVDGIGFTASHASLPVPTFVEVTNLDSGKTVLVRVSGNGGNRTGTLIGLSQFSAQELGFVPGSRAPVRVRRVNPPLQEQYALQNGEKGAERLETPPQLLAALRKKLGVAPLPPAPVRTAAIPPMRPAPTPVNMPMSEPVEMASDDGFIVEEEGARRAAVAAPRRPVRPVAAPAPSNGEFVVEEAGQARRMAPQGNYFVQVAAFSNEDRARALAQRINGEAARSGNVWRVRQGPYASEASARSALGRIAANGYRDARITR